jgi:G3E family GTPase
MHLLPFSGFLGSGKTTLIIPLSKAVVQSRRRVATIVNEIGEIGIDNQLMHADLIIITKTDIASPAEIEFAPQKAHAINPDARIIEGYLGPELISELLPWLN